jgi:hypothetical protein
MLPFLTPPRCEPSWREGSKSRMTADQGVWRATLQKDEAQPRYWSTVPTIFRCEKTVAAPECCHCCMSGHLREDKSTSIPVRCTIAQLPETRRKGKDAAYTTIQAAAWKCSNQPGTWQAHAPGLAVHDFHHMLNPCHILHHKCIQRVPLAKAYQECARPPLRVVPSDINLPVAGLDRCSSSCMNANHTYTSNYSSYVHMTHMHSCLAQVVMPSTRRTAPHTAVDRCA